MNSKNSFTLSVWLLVTTLVSSSVVAQSSESTLQAPSEKSVLQKTADVEEVKWNFDHLAKRPTSPREQQIVDKIVNVVTNDYDSVEDAFSKLDLDGNGNLDRSEVTGLLKLARLSRIVRIVATGRLIDRYDVSNDDSIQWPEFNFAITKAIDKADRLAKQTAQTQR